MNIRNSLKVLERVGDIATLAGFKGRIDDERAHFALGLGFDNGRSQMVYVRDVSRSPERQIITVFSPCLVRKKGFWNGVSKELAIQLLRRNETVHFARYGIWGFEKEDMIVASIDHLLETLDPPEFEASVFHVAVAADALEREHGQDDF
jgi:hypothetical protein